MNTQLKPIVTSTQPPSHHPTRQHNISIFHLTTATTQNMKRQILSLVAVVASSAAMVSSFAPAARLPTSSPRPTVTTKTTSSKLTMVTAIDPSSLHHFLLSAIDETPFTTADAAAKAIAESPAAAAAAAADGGNGWFGFLTLPIEYLLQAIHGLLATSAISSNAWGVSIIVMTVMIKAATYPLTRSQLESTNKMQVSSI